MESGECGGQAGDVRGGDESDVRPTLRHDAEDSGRVGIGEFDRHVRSAGPFAETNPELVKAFVRAVNRADLVAAKDPAAVGAVLEKYGKLPPQVFAKMRLPVYTDQISADALQGTADLMNHLGFTSKPVDTKEMIWP
ncbi:hypothetical protein GSI01S_13_01150 [Gordonia sihwensis NBRC 108236]|uniref:SsuA/THI5-like domain-containing protein n=1 Tax=Gordonia sihwensis NBRC 108236 TaxID=1223544 RepID=L7LLF7_9ACTN|nr:hypothetical protein GSI01S_13_01150 [Gordonia sihwensis NBRC 108236]